MPPPPQQHERVDTHKRLRAACTTYRALKSEWTDARVETKDALTVMANAALELENAPLIVLPDTLATNEGELRAGIKARREEALARARETLAECAEHVADIRADFEKLANVDRYLAAPYPEDGPVFKTLTFKEFKRAFGRVATMYVDDIVAKEALLRNIVDRRRHDTHGKDDVSGDDIQTASASSSASVASRDVYLAIISAWILDPYVDEDVLDEFDALILRAEL